MDYTKISLCIFFIAILAAHNTFGANALLELSNSRPNHKQMGQHIAFMQLTSLHPRPYKCTTCGACFSVYALLMSHIQSHKYSHHICGICGAICTSREQLAVHCNAHLFRAQWKAVTVQDHLESTKIRLVQN